MMDEEKIPQAEFARFYLEQHAQGSNVYFALTQLERAHRAQAHAVRTGRRTSRFAVWGVIGAACAGIGAIVFMVVGASYQKSDSFNLAGILKGYEHILVAKESLAQFNFEPALFEFHAAHEAFSSQDVRRPSEKLLSFAAAAFERVPFLDFLNDPAAYQEIESARRVADVGALLAQNTTPLFELSHAEIFKDKIGREKDSVSLGGVLARFADGLMREQKQLEGLQKEVSDVVSGDALAESMRGQLHAIQPRLSLLAIRNASLARAASFASWALGNDTAKRFLIVAYNPHRITPGGGTPDVYGVIETAQGAITSITFDDVANFDGELNKKIIPPKPLQKITTAWGMRDAMWFLDAPTAAEKIAGLYQATTGFGVDGVIIINETLFESLFALAGSQTIAEDVVIDAERLRQLFAGKEGRSQIHAALRSVIMAAGGFSHEKIIALKNMIERAFEEKKLALWTRDAGYQRVIENNQWAGMLLKEQEVDYTAVAAYDMEPGASLAVFDANILKHVALTENGEATNTLVVQFSGAALENPHRIYVKTYIPEGSELIESSGAVRQPSMPAFDYEAASFESDAEISLFNENMRIDEKSFVEVSRESGKIVLGAWITVTPKKDAKLLYTYTLPFRIAFGGAEPILKLVFQKQPSVKTKLHVSVSPPEGVRFTAVEGVKEVFLGDFLGEVTNDMAFTAHMTWR